MTIFIDRLKEAGFEVEDQGQAMDIFDAGDKIRLPAAPGMAYTVYDPAVDETCFVEAEKTLQDTIIKGYGIYYCGGRPKLAFARSVAAAERGAVLNVVNLAIDATKYIEVPAERIRTLSEISVAMAYLGSIIGASAKKELLVIERKIVAEADDASNGGRGASILIADIALSTCAYGWEGSLRKLLIEVLKKAANKIEDSVNREFTAKYLLWKCEDLWEHRF